MTEHEHTSTSRRPSGYEQRGHQRPPDQEDRGAVTDALMQTAQDLKEVGLGVGTMWAYDKLKGGKGKDKDK
jgi:hypothetical protein